MKSFIAAIVMSLVGFSAMAEVYVPYNQWTALPFCGGQTKLDCPNTPNAKQTNQCRIHFRNSYGCDQVKLYVGPDFHPNYLTEHVGMKGSFYVDYSKINYWGADYFRIFMKSSATGQYEQIRYQFNY